MSDSFHLYQSVSLSLSSQLVPLSFSHSLLISHPLHCCSTTYHLSVPTITLDTQHILKPLIVTSGEMRCHAVMIPINWVTYLCFLVYKLTRRRFTVFSTDGVSGVTNFKYMTSGFLCCVCRQFSLRSWFLDCCGLV